MEAVQLGITRLAIHCSQYNKDNTNQDKNKKENPGKSFSGRNRRRRRRWKINEQRKSGLLPLPTTKCCPCCPSSASSSSSARATTATGRISCAQSNSRRAAITSCQRKLILLDCICGLTTAKLGLIGLYINERNVTLINQTLEMATPKPTRLLRQPRGPDRDCSPRPGDGADSVPHSGNVRLPDGRHKRGSIFSKGRTTCLKR